jgi:phenylacetate-CoA ligase
MSRQTMEKFIQELRSFQPRTILAYANAMHLFAQYCKESGVSDIRPKSIITTAEVLHEHQRTEIEEVFGCRVFNRYGCREVSVIASECEEHDGMHINADALYFEIIKDDSRPANPGETGDIIITDLYNFGMPFIRYKIEDMGVMTDRKCSCGRGLPLMEMVAGRVTDFLVTPDGTRVSGAALTIYIIANTAGVRQAQFIQNEEKLIILKIVRGNDFNNDSTEFLYQKFHEFFGFNMKVEIQFVDNIPKEASGKYRFSICNLKNDNKEKTHAGSI